jgi:hypothetical protein
MFKAMILKGLECATADLPTWECYLLPESTIGLLLYFPVVARSESTCRVFAKPERQGAVHALCNFHGWDEKWQGLAALHVSCI